MLEWLKLSLFQVAIHRRGEVPEGNIVTRNYFIFVPSLKFRRPKVAGYYFWLFVKI